MTKVSEVATSGSAVGLSRTPSQQTSGSTSSNARGVVYISIKSTSNRNALDQIKIDIKNATMSEEARIRLIYAIPGMFKLASTEDFLKEKREETAREDQ